MPAAVSTQKLWENTDHSANLKLGLETPEEKPGLDVQVRVGVIDAGK